ncbi:MAG: hypothetical protein ACREJC_01560, partial [Tepidisphaeraceae bacterium]
MINRPTRRRWTAAGAVAIVALIGTILLAKPGVVITHQGLRYEGDVVEKGDTIIVTRNGVVTRINRADVASIEYVGSVEEQFRQRMSLLGSRDVKGRIELARFAYDQRAYSLAEEALTSALEIEPGDEQASALLETIRRQRQLEDERARAPQPPARTRAEPTTQSHRYLGPRDINVMRQFELQSGDNVRVQIP